MNDILLAAALAVFHVHPSELVLSTISVLVEGNLRLAATVLAVCGKESSLGQSRAQARLCGAFIPGDQLYVRTPDAQIGRVISVFTGNYSEAGLRRGFAGWRCGGDNHPATVQCRATTGAAYAEQVLGYRRQVLSQLRHAVAVQQHEDGYAP